MESTISDKDGLDGTEDGRWRFEPTDENIRALFWLINKARGDVTDGPRQRVLKLIDTMHDALLLEQEERAVQYANRGGDGTGIATRPKPLPFPPYGIRFNSNFQWSTTSRDVRDGNAAHITREPEQVKAFRDTWRDGIHSYLSYLRDRLEVARDLLAESGSVFVQIGDENVHRVRALMDEVFGEGNACAVLVFRKTTGANSPVVRVNAVASICDYVLWYAKSFEQLKYRQIYLDKDPDVFRRRSSIRTWRSSGSGWSPTSARRASSATPRGGSGSASSTSAAPPSPSRRCAPTSAGCAASSIPAAPR